jgi:hypothetical protein
VLSDAKKRNDYDCGFDEQRTQKRPNHRTSEFGKKVVAEYEDYEDQSFQSTSRIQQNWEFDPTFERRKTKNFRKYVFL